VREWCAHQHAGAGAIEVVGVREVMSRVRAIARAADRDDPVLRAVEILDGSGFLTLEPEAVG